MKSCISSKIAIIGAGFVGSTFAFAAMIRNLAQEIVLIDRNFSKAEGEAMDLEHGLMYVETGRVYASKDYKELFDANIIVITAGINQKPGQSRLELVNTNVGILKDIISNIEKYNKHAVILVVSNPVDILTYFAKKFSSRPDNLIFGSGTVLDSGRFQYLISEYFKVSSQSINGYILGEHGESEFPAWSTVDVGGKHIKECCDFTEKKKKEISDKTRNAAQDIIKRKQATYYGIGLALCDIVESIVFNQNKILPISTFPNKNYTKKKVCMGTPCVIGSQGIIKQIDLDLNAKEKKMFEESAISLEKVIKQVEKK